MVELTDDQLKQLKESLFQIQMAIASLNPDPAKTIAQQRAEQERRDRQVERTGRAAWAAVLVATLSLILSVVQLFGWR